MPYSSSLNASLLREQSACPRLLQRSPVWDGFLMFPGRSSEHGPGGGSQNHHYGYKTKGQDA